LLAQVIDKLPGRSRRLLALDWDDLTFKVVEATLQNNVLRVQRVACAGIPKTIKTGEADSFGPFVRQVLAEKRFSTRHTLMAIPRDKAILINLRLPASPVGDLSSMVRLQASRELPFSADEAVMDFAGAAAHDAPEFLDVTVAAIQRDVMAQYRQLADAAGLSLIRVGLRPNSNLLSVTRGAQPFTDDRILFVDIGAQTTEINIFRWGRLTFSRSVNISVQAAVPADDPAGRPLLMEVLRTFEAYRATDPNKIDQIIIAGDTGLESSLAEALRSRVNAPASLYDPAWTIAVDKDRAAQMTGLAAVLGLLAGQLAPPLARFDFHAPKKPADVAAIRRRQIAACSCAGLVLVAGIWMGSRSYLAAKAAEKADLEARIAVLQKQAEGVDAVGKRVATAQKWMKRDLVWLDKIRDVVQQMPDNSQVYATKLSAKPAAGDAPDARELQLTLRMTDFRIPTDLQKSLAKQPQFAVMPGASRQTGDPKYGHAGDVKIVIRPDKAKPPPRTGASPGGGPAGAAEPQGHPTAPPAEPGEDETDQTAGAQDAAQMDQTTDAAQTGQTDEASSQPAEDPAQ
jgi:Tfp pilus assembly PilM family ATPase